MSPVDPYTPAVVAEILRRLADGESLRSICRDKRMPDRTTVSNWIINDRGGFATQYAHARDCGLDAMAEDALEIADTTQQGVIETDKVTKLGTPYTEQQRRDMTDHRRLRVDTRKWYLSKLAPKRYGDRLALEHSGGISIAERLRAGRKRVGKE